MEMRLQDSRILDAEWISFGLSSNRPLGTVEWIGEFAWRNSRWHDTAALTKR
jgi:hypothetical protein